ncbi:AMP-binding protein [Kineosporia sp. R_H_3]|uniref:AMP-binding protein n=1 Tax=Kineosporia sp. R_H_3 TaxID=1961848 RepID=UPI001304755E|nr:AMP-binding protein [Kineosporia sp. R_H_3]
MSPATDAAAGAPAGPSAPARRQSAVGPIGELLRGLPVLVRAGVVNPARPDHGIRQLRHLRQFGPTLAGGFASAADRAPDRVAVVDETHSLTFAELVARSTAIARGMASLGVGQSDTVAILGPNEVAFVEALVATSRLGADAVLLSTFLSAEQLTRVVEREKVRLVVVHPDLMHVLSDIPPDVVVVTTGAAPDGGLDLDGLARTEHPLPKQHRRGRIVILTSGTTGVPKSARRPAPSGLGPVASMLSGFPLRAGETIMISSPLFHTWALGMLQLAPAIVSTVVLRKRADAETVLAALSAHRCTALVGVPVILDRLCSLPVQVRATHDTSRLRVVASSGAALLPDLVTRFHAAFGPVLHNLYGATEVSWATIAGPQDLEAAPGTVGRAPFGTRLVILGDDDEPLPAGRIGRVYVGNSLLFDGYSDGGDRPRLGGLIATGDRGWLDEDGRLMLSGREDGMVNTGGEKVHPEEVEQALSGMPGVREVAVRGWPHPDMGQQVVAYVVRDDEGTALDAEIVREYARRRLSRFAVPREVVFVDELPRTPTGKVVPRLLPPPPGVAG